MRSVRTLLALSRPAHLPTVWSNCIAGWVLAGGRQTSDLPLLLIGLSLLFLGGSFLNHAFDADHDRLHRPKLPLPAGEITAKTVWEWGLGFLVGGVVLLLWARLLAGVFGLALVLCIIAFSALHRLVVFSPVLLGMCRLLAYLIGASAAREITGLPIWCGIAVALYVTGTGLLAQARAPRERLPYWEMLLLACPILLALVVNGDVHRQGAALMMAVLALWILRSLRYTLWSLEPDPPRTARELTAGIVFADWLAVGPTAPRELSFLLLGLFLLVLAIQWAGSAAQAPK